MPSLFLAHGAPDLVLGNLPAKRFLEGLGEMLPRPRAILAVSAHWEAAAATLTTSAAPETVHDFHGWPAPLFALRYPAVTDRPLIERVGSLLAAASLPVARDPQRGFDHGTWVPLLLSYPSAKIPVVQLSLLRGADGLRHFEIGRALAPLAAEGVLVVGSGASVHNLRELAPEGSPPPAWAEAFDLWLFEHTQGADLDALLRFPAEPAWAHRAHPSIEHLLPFFVAMGAGGDSAPIRRLHHSYTYGSIGMSCYAFGGIAENFSVT